MVSGALTPVVLLGSAVHVVVLRLPWLPLQLGAPGSKVCQVRGCARGLSRYSGTVRVLSSSWTPSLSGRVAIQQRERRQWDSDFVLVVGGTDTSRRTGPQLVLFPVPHFRELRPESLKTCVNDIPCEASARSREAESYQARYQVNGNQKWQIGEIIEEVVMIRRILPRG
ncbi:hypothetical protein Taro_048642 [Colocasia esculenta]|uniref:Uncharacterized protein n=1 Tax=Colocasia esculenta TaxID=4460 RepID=A0A843X8P4_COLES|nr:hypothetical protein [Colocasia esculenta]